MRNRKNVEHSYAKLLFLSIFFVAVFYVINTIVPEFWKMENWPFYNQGDAQSEEELAKIETVSQEECMETEVMESQEESLEEEQVEIETETVIEEETSIIERERITADRSYFDDALFIGDSRTEGLYEYGNLQNATVAAETGMNVYKVFETEFQMPGGEKKTLNQILLERDFGKVYIMLGVNELGYEFDVTFQKYEELLATVMEYEPNAIIYLEANLHVTEKKSKDSPYCKNEKIDRFNSAIEELCDGNSLIYLDVNRLFDNEAGALDTQYTVDQSHVLGKYYDDWVEYILSEARAR